jgi:formate dehydrogenase iron-sulfur subunit
MSLNRRNFLKILGIAGSGALIKPVKSKAATINPKDEIAVLYDASKCVGCKSCQNACKRIHGLPPEIDESGLYDAPKDLSEKTWSLIELAKGGDKHPFFFRRCFHCTDASCVNVCPTGAAHHTENGAVVIDQTWCIGCGYCAEACPFGVPHLGEGKEKATARKCDLNYSRLKKGEIPACVANCTTGALSFGKRKALIAKARKRIEELKEQGYKDANLYGDFELGGMHHLSILLDKPSVYGLPEKPKVATSLLAESWLSGLFGAGLISVLIMPFWLTHRKEQEKLELKSKMDNIKEIITKAKEDATDKSQEASDE